jgi:hypothetical protein
MQTSQQINNSKIYLRATRRQRIIAGIIFFAIALFFGSFAAAGRSDADMGSWLGRCGFKQNYGLPCPSCGMTSSTLAFAQGKILQAFYIQPACGFLCSVLVFIAAVSFIVFTFGIYFRFITRFFNEVKVRYMILAFAIIIVSGWAVTLARALAQRS